jgi:mono/diheme cytochrome c family protein
MRRTWTTAALSCALWAAVMTAGCSGRTPATAEGERRPSDPMLAAINDDYVESVKPLFARSCASCHGAGKSLPWYHALPLVQKMIDDDIAKARRSVDISHDFPFRGRGTPAEYLDAVDQVVSDGSMPPLRYRAMHWGSALSAEERDRVRAWVERSRRSFPR